MLGGHVVYLGTIKLLQWFNLIVDLDKRVKMIFAFVTHKIVFVCHIFADKES